MQTMVDSSNIVTILLIVLCFLASLDLWRQYALNSADYWFYQYSAAVGSDDTFWKLGYRLEELELKASAQKYRWNDVRHTVESLAPHFRLDPKSLRKNQHDFLHTRKARIAINSLQANESSFVRLHCEEDGPLFRIGFSEFRTDSRDMCQIFTGSKEDYPGPETMFERVRLDEGAFALRAVTTGQYITAISPPPESSTLPWKLVVGGPVPGAAERFRYTDDHYLYSGIIGGFFQCGPGLMVKGFSGIYGTFNKIHIKEVDEKAANRALELVHLSRQIAGIQKTYIESHQSSLQARKAAVNMATGGSPAPVKICIGVPMTSKGTQMSSVADSPLWSNLFDSFMKSIDWRSNKYIFKLYLGFDRADGLYDTGDAWSEMRDEFHHRAVFRMTEQLMPEAAIAIVLEKYLTLKIMHFDHLEGAPTQVVSQLMLSAYVDNFDYFYQVNDDTIIVTPNWPPKLIASLASNPSIPNFGVTGPLDTNNDKIFTHAFVHRTHIEVFGHLFPPSFKNWWSDDWISTVYGSEHTIRTADVEIKHNVGAQKVKGYTRYEVDQGAQLRLSEELRKGHVQIDEWLKKNALPRLPLPSVCGYIPLVRHLADTLRAKAGDAPAPIVPIPLEFSSVSSVKSSSVLEAVGSSAATAAHETEQVEETESEQEQSEESEQEVEADARAGADADAKAEEEYSQTVEEEEEGEVAETEEEGEEGAAEESEEGNQVEEGEGEFEEGEFPQQDDGGGEEEQQAVEEEEEEEEEKKSVN